MVAGTAHRSQRDRRRDEARTSGTKRQSCRRRAHLRRTCRDRRDHPEALAVWRVAMRKVMMSSRAKLTGGALSAHGTASEGSAFRNLKTKSEFLVAVAFRKDNDAFCSPTPNQYAGAKNDRSAKGHLYSCGECRRLHEPMPHPCDYAEFHHDDCDRDPDGQRESVGEKWQSMSNATYGRHAAADDTSQKRMSPAGEASVV